MKYPVVVHKVTMVTTPTAQSFQDVIVKEIPWKRLWKILRMRL